MHNNYFFLSALVKELSQKLHQSTLIECFSQSPNELVLGIVLEDESEFWIKANLSSNFSCLSFPLEFARSKKYSINYFKELNGLPIVGIKMFDNERAFRLSFKGGYHLLFKLFGNRSNVSLYKEEEGIKSFSNQFFSELEKPLSAWNRILEYSEQDFENRKENLSQIVPTLGKELLEYFSNRELTFDEFQSELMKLGKKGFYVTEKEGRPKLLLFGEGGEWFRSPMEAVTSFYNAYIRIESFERTQKELIQKCISKSSQHNKRLKKLNARLNSLIEEQPLNQIADVVMANLHAIPQGALEVELFDFYTNNMLKVNFKRGQKPQMFAEQLYRKSKNRSKEVLVLEDNIAHIGNELYDLSELHKKLKDAFSFKELKPYIKEAKQTKNKVEEPRFKEYLLQGYKILVGRNSNNNDELTKSAHKDDLWLHAKDVSGSHVIIKNKNIEVPKIVIEYAASIAAYFSKRKTDSLCPVIYTPRKFVRKVKGAPAGSVVVEKEQVILVPPINKESL